MRPRSVTIPSLKLPFACLQPRSATLNFNPCITACGSQTFYALFIERATIVFMDEGWEPLKWKPILSPKALKTFSRK